MHTETVLSGVKKNINRLVLIVRYYCGNFVKFATWQIPL